MIKTEQSSLAMSSGTTGKKQIAVTSHDPVVSYQATRFLDGLRGLAALYVVIHHASYLLYEGSFLRNQSGLEVPDLSRPEQIFDAFISLFRWGNGAVLFFFVLSGFVIHLRYSKQLAISVRFQWKNYVWRRVKRLCPPLLMAILVTFCVDNLGFFFGFPNYTGNTSYAFLNHVQGLNFSWLLLLANMSFLMYICTPTWGSDGPLWSLAYEWWFYMIYPIFWLVVKKLRGSPPV